MAGSYRHITTKNNEFIGIDLIDNLGDAYEALEECFLMIDNLSGGDKQRIFEAWRDTCPIPEKRAGCTFNEFWLDY